MKKSIIAIIAAVMLATVSLSACTKSADNTPTQAQQTTEAAQTATGAATQSAQSAQAVISKDDVVFSYNGKTVTLNSDAASMLSALGEAKSVASQLSCHGEGEDKTYTYDGFSVNTYPDNGTDRVMEIVVSSAELPTSKGVKVGDSVDAVTSAYGQEFKKVGAYYSYDAGDDMSLQFFIENNAVAEIDYYYNAAVIS